VKFRSIQEDEYIKSLTEVFQPQEMPKGYRENKGVELALRRKTIFSNAQQRRFLKPQIAAIARKYGSLRLLVEIIHGTEVILVPAKLHSVPLANDVADAILTVLDGIGHMPHHCFKSAVVEAVERAVKRAGLC
jgi:hypothetical protein